MGSFDAALWSFAAAWLLEHGTRLALILVGAFLVEKASGRFIERAVRGVVTRGSGTKESERQREDTLIQVFRSTAVILIWITAGLMALAETGVAIGPLLAAAGVVGVAVGFGGQYLIRDVISGLFMLVENQYRVGDVVCFDGTCGLVEHISLRMTRLRDLDGTVHCVPHGGISRVSNLSKDFARVNLNVGVSYGADLATVIAVVDRTGAELAADPAWKDRIVSAPKFLRVDDFGDSAITVKILGDTKPLAQWDVTGELRKRIKIAFDREGIEIPFPQRVIHQAR